MHVGLLLTMLFLFTDQLRSLKSTRPIYVCYAGPQIYYYIWTVKDIFRERYNCKQLNVFFVGSYRLIKIYT